MKGKKGTCLFAGLRPHERRTVCLPITVPFSFCNASSALFLSQEFKNDHSFSNLNLNSL